MEAFTVAAECLEVLWKDCGNGPVMKLYHAIISGGHFKFYSLVELGRELSKQEKTSDKLETAAPRKQRNSSHGEESQDITMD